MKKQLEYSYFPHGYSRRITNKPKPPKAAKRKQINDTDEMQHRRWRLWEVSHRLYWKIREIKQNGPPGQLERITRKLGDTMAELRAYRKTQFQNKIQS